MSLDRVRFLSFDSETLSDLVYLAPNLRHIEIAEEVPQRYLKNGQGVVQVRNTLMDILARFQNLSRVDIVRLTYRHRKMTDHHDTRLPDLVESVRTMLQNSPCADRKALRVITRHVNECDGQSYLALHRSTPIGLPQEIDV